MGTYHGGLVTNDVCTPDPEIVEFPTPVFDLLDKMKIYLIKSYESILSL